MPKKNSSRDPQQRSDLKLKDFLLDKRKEWYASISPNLAPRVGRPAQQTQHVVDTINALVPVFQRIERGRSGRPDRVYPPISQGQLKRWVTRRLKRTIDEKIVRDVCKKFRLVRGRKTMRDYTLEEWAWLVKHSTRSDKEKARALVASFIKNSAMKLNELKDRQFRPQSENIISEIRKWEISYYTNRMARYQRVLQLFLPHL